MKKQLILMIGLILAFGISAFAQGYWDDEELTLGVGLRHADTKLATPTSVSQFGLADPRNAVLIKGGYTHFIGGKDRRGNFGIGLDGAVALSGNDEATDDSGNIAIGRAALKLVLQDNRPDKAVRFGVKGTAGIGREQFKNRTAQSGDTIINSRGENAWTLGGGAMVDFGKGRKRLRLEFEYYKSFYRNQNFLFPERADKHNFEATVGVVL